MNLYAVVPVIKSNNVHQDHIKENKRKQEIHKKEFKDVLSKVIEPRLEHTEKRYVTYNDNAKEIYYRLSNQINYKI